MFNPHLLPILLLVATLAGCSEQKLPTTAVPISNDQPQPPGPKRIFSDADGISDGLLGPEGSMWFGTWKDGLLRFDGTTWTQWTTEDGLAHNDVGQLLWGPDGRLYCGTYEGVSIFDGESFEQLPLPPGPNDALWAPIMTGQSVIALFFDSRERLWVGTAGAGVYCFDQGERTQYLHHRGWLQKDSLHHNLVSSVLETPDGDLWFTSMTHGGVSRLRDTTWTHWGLEEGLADDMVLCSLQDSKGNLWFGALGNNEGGLQYFKDGTFGHYTEADGVVSNNVSAICEDKFGRLWLGSQREGITIKEGDTFTPFIPQNQEMPRDLRFITPDADGNLWFGGRYAKLWKYNLKTEELTDYTEEKRNHE